MMCLNQPIYDDKYKETQIHSFTKISFLVLLDMVQARGSCASFVFGFVTFMSIGGFPSFVEDMKVSFMIPYAYSNNQFTWMKMLII